MPTRVVRALLPITALWTAAFSAPPETAHGQTRVTPAERTSLGVTVYSGFAQIRDTRPVAGEGEILWTGFPSSIDPGTILLTRDGERVTPDVLGVRSGSAIEPRALYAAHLGQPVVLVAEDGREIPAEIVSEAPVFRAGDRLILDWQGHVELPTDGAGPIGRGIRWRAAGPGEGPLTMSYLADGLAWSADYTAIFDEGGPIELTGSVTIENRTDLAYPDARIQLVAGDVRRGGAGAPQPRFAMAEARVADAAPVPEREALGDVHLYTLPEPVTLGAEETVRTPLFQDATVDVEREYVLRGQRFWYQSEHPGFPPRENPEVWLHFRNQGLAGAGEPLPAGILHVYRRDEGGALQFAGDGSIPDTPDGERIDVVIGSAFDLVAERVQTDFRRLDQNTHESAWRITIRNRSTEDRTVQVYEPLPGDATIVEESQSHERIDADTVRWPVPVESGGESTLTYRVRTTF
ncbi:MAG: DUF4139 domain-containing protein [Gemmatimonadota bacterium]